MAEIPLPNPSTGKNGWVHNQVVTVLPDNAIEITPSDDNHFPSPVMVWAGAAGDVAVIPWGAREEASPSPVVFPLLAGGIVPVRVWKVMATDTDSIPLRGQY